MSAAVAAVLSTGQVQVMSPTVRKRTSARYDLLRPLCGGCQLGQRAPAGPCGSITWRGWLKYMPGRAMFSRAM